MTRAGLGPDRLLEYVRDLAAFHRALGRNLTHVAIFSAFLDESVSQHHLDLDPRVYTMAGYVGTVDGWTGFDPQWSAIIQPLRVGYFHMAEYENALLEPRGPYARDTALSMKVFNRLIDLVRDYTEPNRPRLWPFTMTLDLRNWDVLPADIQAVLVDPYHTLMRSLTQFVTKGCHSTDGTPTRVQFIFETPPITALIGICTEAFNAVRDHEPWGEMLLGIEFAPKGRYRGNEAADILAYDTRKHVAKLVVDGHPLNATSRPWRYSTKRLVADGREIRTWFSDLSDAYLKYE